MRSSTSGGVVIAAQYLEVSAEVRYWEDATLNGKADDLGEMPLRTGDAWAPVIDLESGQVRDWPEGTVANVHYKVCDQGEYWLLDSQKTRIAQWRGDYVPDSFLCVHTGGYGDYIILQIAPDGRVRGWTRPEIRLDEWRPL